MRAGARRLIWRARARVIEWLGEDVKRLALWTPVAIGLGAGLYFGLKTEPEAAAGVFALAASAAAAAWSARARPFALALFFAALGFSAADWRAARVAAPVLERELSIRPVVGRLTRVEEGKSARRLIIELQSIRGLDADKLPERARVTWRGEDMLAAPGDMVKLRAGLRPPPPPAAPGDFDFARRLYFQRIGAVGFAVSAPAPVVGAGASARGWASMIETMRASVFRRITNAATGQGGAIVAAIVTGKRDAVSENSRQALRDAGLAHLLAISGLHMGLAMGSVFFGLRAGLALLPPLALRFPIKKWAALAALFCGGFYLILSGSGWSARRAFITAAVMFAAILIDRRAISLRNIAIAATIILLTTPEALIHAGFQMSFAAATALVAAYEWASARVDPNRSFAWPALGRRYATGIAATDVITSLATAPFALYHFNRAALYSLPANLLAWPLMAFWVIPTAVVALALSPLGWDAWAWRFAAAGVDWVLVVGGAVSSWPGAVALTPQWPLGALLALTFGGLFLCLARSPLRLAGLMSIPIAYFLTHGATPPDIFVAASGRNAGVVAAGEGALYIYTRRRDRFSAGAWREAAGMDRRTKSSGLAEIGQCGPAGCTVALTGKGQVSFIEDPLALAEDCARADLVVAFFYVSGADWRRCEATLIDAVAVRLRGAHAVWLTGGVARLRTVAEVRGVRPWAPGDQ